MEDGEESPAKNLVNNTEETLAIQESFTMDEEVTKMNLRQPAIDDEDETNRVYCVCKQGWGTMVDEKMIGCDGFCNEWYHPSCILMTKHEQNLIDSNNEIVWVCDSC